MFAMQRRTMLCFSANGIKARPDVDMGVLTLLAERAKCRATDQLNNEMLPAPSSFLAKPR